MDYFFLTKTKLFQGTSSDEIKEMLHCLGAEKREFKKGDFVFHAGDTTESMGIVLSGSVIIENSDMWGNNSILNHVGPGQIFAEAYACIPGEPLMVSAIAKERCEILFLNVARILKTCSNTCSHHQKLIRNLLAVNASKNLSLSRRILHTSAKSIRGRLISYLSDLASRQGSCRVTIPFNRQQLADYLNVDRSALSNELGKMQKDELIEVEKNHFILKNL